MASRFGLLQIHNQYSPIMQAYHLPGTYDSNFFAYLWSEFINGTVAKKDLRNLEYKHVRVDGEYDSPVSVSKENLIVINYLVVAA